MDRVYIERCCIRWYDRLIEQSSIADCLHIHPLDLSGVLTENAGIKVVERAPIIVPPLATTAEYLKTKREKLGHLLDVPEIVPDRGVPS